MSIFEILKTKDSFNPILANYKGMVSDDVVSSEKRKHQEVCYASQVVIPANVEETFNLVGKALVRAYRRGEVCADELFRTYRKNVSEAEAFCVIGYRIPELKRVIATTHNPALKTRLSAIVEEKYLLQKKSNTQNRTTLEKLNMFKRDVLGTGVGLRKCIASMRKYCKKTRDRDAQIILLLLETEFANVNAKRLPSIEKKMAYERKARLLYRLSILLRDAGWKTGYNDMAGKNASYLVYVYLPSGVQLTWHSNDYMTPRYYDYISDEWDGQVCMTLEKILSYIMDHYRENICGSTSRAA